MQPEDRFRLLAGVAFADGRLDDAERAVLKGAARRLGLQEQAAQSLLAEIQAGGKVKNLTPPADPQQRAALFDELLRVVAADEVVSPDEERCLKRLAPLFGVTADQLPALLARKTRPAGAASAPQLVPPPPPPGYLVPPPPGIQLAPPLAVASMIGAGAAMAAATTHALAAPSAPPRTKVTGKLKPPPRPGEATCPSCGAGVAFRNSRSVARVCEYCDTTVVRQDGEKALRDLGSISHVVPDASPIQLGSSGTVFGVAFEVLGRLQVQHERGYWNEWYLEWADRRTGWLGEALGQYLVTFPDSADGLPPDEKLPPFEQVKAGQKLFIHKKRWTVTDVRVARATGTEGETPFAIGEGYELPYADLRRSDDGFATIDYSEEKPLLFLGRCVSWAELNLERYRRFDGW